MTDNRNFHYFDIDLDHTAAIQRELEANIHQVKAAHARAMSRTLVTMQKLSRKVLQDEMGAKSSKILKNRVKGFLIKASGELEVKLWFGLNDIAAHALKGSMRKTADGAEFKSQKLGTHQFQKGFITQKGGKKYLFKRNGSSKGDYNIARIALPDSTQIRIEDDIFGELPDVYLRHFETDLKGRVKTGLNKNGAERTRNR